MNDRPHFSVICIQVPALQVSLLLLLFLLLLPLPYDNRVPRKTQWDNPVIRHDKSQQLQFRSVCGGAHKNPAFSRCRVSIDQTDLTLLW
jgi:hypothetical protein